MSSFRQLPAVSRKVLHGAFLVSTRFGTWLLPEQHGFAVARSCTLQLDVFHTLYPGLPGLVQQSVLEGQTNPLG